MTADQDHAPELTVTQARQASRGRHMAWVLGVSMTLVVAGFAALWFVSAPGLSGRAGQTTAPAQQATGFHAGASAPQTGPTGS